MNLSNKKNKGFTLIEILVSISIISTITLSFFTVINSSMKQNIKNEMNIKLLNIAKSEIESLRKEIKTYGNYIQIHIGDELYIEIPNENNIIWETKQNQEIIKIDSNGIYKEFIGTDNYGNPNNSIIQYDKDIEGNIYTVKLSLSRTPKKKKKYLYSIDITVESKKNHLGEQETTLNTKILSK